MLCNSLFCKVIEVYFKNGNIVILIHSIWNNKVWHNKIFPQQIREDRTHDKLSLKKVVTLLHNTHKTKC